VSCVEANPTSIVQHAEHVDARADRRRHAQAVRLPQFGRLDRQRAEHRPVLRFPETPIDISYGFQIGSSARSRSRASEDIDPRMAVAGDRGPYADGQQYPGPSRKTAAGAQWDAATGQMTTPQAWRAGTTPAITAAAAPVRARTSSSAMGTRRFEKTPIVGIDRDNIYTRQAPLTAMAGNPQMLTPLTSGLLPANFPNAYPGLDSLDGNADTSTDSLIFP
jgi:hypothetical protein